MRTFLNTVGLIAVIIFILTFSMQNNHIVELTYYYDLKLACPAYFLVLIPFFVGVIGGNMMAVIGRLKLKREIRMLRKGIKKGEEKDSLSQ